MAIEISPVNCNGVIPVNISASVEVMLTLADIKRWLDNVTDVKTLRDIAKYARCQADSLEQGQDDFRSRA